MPICMVASTTSHFTLTVLHFGNAGDFLSFVSDEAPALWRDMVI